MSKQNGDVPYQCDAYPVAAIIAANARHDRLNGWSADRPNLFTNLGRLPETTTRPAERAFERDLNSTPDALGRDLSGFDGENAQTYASRASTPQIKPSDDD